jgi:hypothetical protein
MEILKMTTPRKPKSKRLAAPDGSAWAALWRSKNKIDGFTTHLIYSGGRLAIFKTRRLAREFITREYGYITARPDLQAEPHGWKLPTAVKVTVKLNR